MGDLAEGWLAREVDRFTRQTAHQHQAAVAGLAAFLPRGTGAAFDPEAACEYVSSVLLASGPMLVTDNLGARKTPEVRGLLDGSGFPYRYLPSYSRDPTRSSRLRRQVKAELRRAAARDEGALQRALGPALDRVSTANATA